jgi:hypothetical protein
MHRKVALARGAEGVGAGIGPDVRAVAAVPAQLDGVDVQRSDRRAFFTRGVNRQRQ